MHRFTRRFVAGWVFQLQVEKAEAKSQSSVAKKEVAAAKVMRLAYCCSRLSLSKHFSRSLHAFYYLSVFV